MSIDLSLDRLRILISHLPPYTRPTCHIAGTNGKGSVSALLSTILQSLSSSLKVGRYNSPHLVSIYDCITIDNIPVSPASYNAAHAEVTEKDLEKGSKLSSFEILTLTALRVFEREKVDVAVVEVGMGGRLDATNIIPDNSILVSALTAVGLDHQFFLGDTVGKIAFEKAGIARKKTPFVLGFQNLAHARQVETSVKMRWEQCWLLLLQFSNVIGMLLSMDHNLSRSHFISNIPVTFIPTCRNLPPLFLLPASSPPSSLRRTPARQSWRHTYSDQCPPDWSLMQRKVKSQLLHPQIHFDVSKKHNNTRIRGKRDQRNQMAWKTFVPYRPSLSLS